MTFRKAPSGFALLELIVVLGLLALVATYALSNRASQRNTIEQGRAGTDYSEEMRMLARAAQTFVGEQTWAVTTVNTVTIPQLQTAGLIPAGFAQRSLGAGRAPFGTTYTVRARKNAGGDPPTIVVYETGTGSDLYANALGYASANAPETVPFRRNVAALLREERFAAATIARGTRIANGAGSAPWTKDLTDMIPAALQSDSVAVLLGYLDLSGTIGNEPTEPGQFAGDCRVVTAQSMCKKPWGASSQCDASDATWSEAVCSAALGAGWEKLDTVTVCPPVGQASFRATPVGTLSYATKTTITPNAGVCTASCDGAYPCQPNPQSAWQHIEEFQDMRLNDQSIATPSCRSRRDYNQYIDPYGGGPTCGFVTSDRPWGNPTVLASSPRHVLCCKSN